MISKRELLFRIDCLAEEIDDLKLRVHQLEKAAKPKKTSKKVTKKNAK